MFGDGVRGSVSWRTASRSRCPRPGHGGAPRTGLCARGSASVTTSPFPAGARSVFSPGAPRRYAARARGHRVGSAVSRSNRAPLVRPVQLAFRGIECTLLPVPVPIFVSVEEGDGVAVGGGGFGRAARVAQGVAEADVSFEEAVRRARSARGPVPRRGAVRGPDAVERGVRVVLNGGKGSGRHGQAGGVELGEGARPFGLRQESCLPPEYAQVGGGGARRSHPGVTSVRRRSRPASVRRRCSRGRHDWMGSSAACLLFRIFGAHRSARTGYKSTRSTAGRAGSKPPPRRPGCGRSPPRRRRGRPGCGR